MASGYCIFFGHGHAILQRRETAMSTKQYAIGIDLGGTKIKIALIDSQGKIVREKEIRTAVEEGPERIQEHMIKVIESLCDTVSPFGIGIGIPGQLDRDGTIVYAPNLGWRHVPLQANLSKKLHLPAVSINDVKAATLGEWHFGAGRKCADFVCLFLGTGIGGGIVSNGFLLKGATNTAGELGHMIVDMNGSPCTCGGSGCLESIAGGWAIAKRAKEEAKRDPLQGAHLLKKCNNTIDAITTKMVVEASIEGDSLSHSIISRAIDALVSAGITIVNVLNPSRIILGGGVFEGIPELITHIENGIQKQALEAARGHVQVVEAELRNNAGVIGAGYLAFEKFGDIDK